MGRDADEAVETVYRSNWGWIVATLIRLFEDFDVAEEAAQEAFAAAVGQWRVSGVPECPPAWIIQTARHKAIDRIRSRTRLKEKLESQAAALSSLCADPPDYDPAEIPDDRLRLIFTCCHPAIPLDARIALTLRTVCGLQTAEIARAFLVPAATMAQRLVRAKRKIRCARIPYRVPGTEEMPERLDAVLAVIHVVFNEGRRAGRGGSRAPVGLRAEAIRLGRLVRKLMAPQPPAEATGLLALMLLHDARLEEDRGRWNRRQIAEAVPLAEEALRGGPGLYAVQAAIAAEHCKAARAEDTDWPRIVELYEMLERLQPVALVSLHRAVALAMVDGAQAGLTLIDALTAGGAFDGHPRPRAGSADGGG